MGFIKVEYWLGWKDKLGLWMTAERQTTRLNNVNPVAIKRLLLR
jgi:hypothetical protein